MIRFGQFIVIDSDSDFGKMYRNEEYKYTMSDQLIFEVGSFVPVICPGKGCIGIAKIKSLLISETSTRITFIGIEEAKGDSHIAYYNMFKLTVFNQNMTDPYAAIDEMDEPATFRNLNSGRDEKKKSSSVGYSDLFRNKRERY